MPTYRLTIPPTTNTLYRVYKGRAIKSREYRTWLDENGVSLRLQGGRAVKQPARVTLRITGGTGFNRSRDGDNLWKAVLDLLRFVGVIESDCFVDLPELHAVYLEDRRKGAIATCTVEIETLESVPCQT